MAMNKTEKAAFEKLQEDLRIARAFRFTDPVEPDIPRPTSGADTDGFLFNEHRADVLIAASSAVSHAITHIGGVIDKGRYRGGWSQGARALYSTRELALKAMRHVVELECAKKLANIDREIEKEGA